MSTITREQAKDLRNALECWQQDYDAADDKEQYEMFGLGVVAMDALLASLDADPYGYLRENDGQIQLSIGPERPHDRSSGYATPWAAIYAAPPAPVVAELCAAIEVLLNMQVRMVKQTNHSASFFDSETISAMNYAPILAKQALELAKPYK